MASSNRKDYPNIGLIDFGRFCHKTYFYDKQLNSQIVDTLFVAVNFEDNSNGYDGDDNPDKLLCRYEFLEILIRIAAEKYIKTKKCTTYTEAFKAILNDFVYPYYKTGSW